MLSHVHNLCMSNVLPEAFVLASRLSENDQDTLARIVDAELEEISRRAGPESALAKLGWEAWAQHEAGRTLPLS